MLTPSKRISICIASIILAASSNVVEAQRVTFRWVKPDCDVRQKAYDNPLSDTHGYVLPKVVWHSLYAGVSEGGALLLYKTTPLNRKQSAIVSTLAIGLVAHVRGGIINKSYPINVSDWIFDLNNRALPVYLLDDNKWRGIGKYAVSYVSTMCFAEP